MNASFDRLKAAIADRYNIERELGQGGMATVYLAEDMKHHRKVAVKVLRPELAATLGSDRFFREIEVAAQLQHPHILPLLDSGEADGFYYYVMPYVAGESLRERLARVGELPIHEAVKILSEVADALAAAHAMGVVHRDIKPDNVMLTGRHALVMDFGVAKAVSEATGRNQLTTAGVALGTPAYMAPEQAAADPHLDHRVDIYALGAMAYELLTGRPPFSGGTSQEILAAHVTRMPEPVTASRPAISPPLAAVIMKCLEKRPADRFQTAEDLLAHLEPLATPSGGMTPTQTRPVEALPAKAPKRTLWAVGAAAALVVAIVLGLTRHSRHTPATLRDRTQLTSSGRVSYPAISPDGKQLAYAATTCKAGACSYGIEVMDVGGTASRRVFDGATALYSIDWSPDRRNLLFAGTVAGHYGFYLQSALGGAPRFITPGGAAFWAGGDSLLVVPLTRPDSVFWVRVAGLDGVARDSIRVPQRAEGFFILGSVPDSPWIIVSLWRSPNAEMLAIDRQGQEGGRLSLRLTGLNVRLSADALWMQVFQAGGNARPPIVRAPFDSKNGHFSEQMDTVYTGRPTRFGVTDDGGTLVLDEGTSEYSGWTLDLHDALRGTFAEDHRLVRSTTPINFALSPDGGRVLESRSAGAAGGGDQLTVTPFTGGAETALPYSGSLINWFWGDSVTVALAQKTAAGVQLTLTDIRTGARRGPFNVSDSTIADWTPLPDDGWAWIPILSKSIRVQRHGEATPRSFPIPDWYAFASAVEAAPGGKDVAFLGWNTPGNDSIGLGVMSVADGKVTPWAAFFAEGARLRWMPDGSILILVWESQETITLYQVRGPGRIERLGTIPRPVAGLSVSSDLRRAVVLTREYHGDAWMSKVVRP